MNSNKFKSPLTISDTKPEKMITDIPFPTPLLEQKSPIHINDIVPNNINITDVAINTSESQYIHLYLENGYFKSG